MAIDTLGTVDLFACAISADSRPVVVANNRTISPMVLREDDDMAAVGCLKMAAYSTLQLR